MAEPQPQTCHGREQLARVLGQQADRGFVSEVEEIASSDDKVMVAVHTPGADQRRAWQSEDHSYLVLTMDRGGSSRCVTSGTGTRRAASLGWGR